MRKIKIVADSSCDLLELSDIEFSAAALKIITADREFVDDDQLDTDGMIEYLDQYKGKSKSACPGTGDWLEAFGDADEIICFTITSGLSGSYNSASSAKLIYESEHEGKRVCVFDTLSTGPEMVLAIEKTREYAEQNLPFEEICDKIQRYLDNAGLLFMLKSLKTFANNGRISPVVAKIVGIAGICIVGKASAEGTLQQLHKCRGERRGLENLVKSLEDEGFRSGKISIGHCQNLKAAEQLKDMILAKFNNVEIEIHKLRGLCSFYAEKGGVLVGFERAE